MFPRYEQSVYKAWLNKPKQLVLANLFIMQIQSRLRDNFYIIETQCIVLYFLTCPVVIYALSFYRTMKKYRQFDIHTLF